VSDLPLTSHRFDVSVVIVTYNSADDVEECLRAVRSARSAEVVVVDNDSPDGTPALLESLREEGLIDVLVLGADNSGFAKAVNTGIRASSGRDVFLLNPDAIISGADLDALVAEANAQDRVGVAAPVVNSGPTVDVMAAGRQPRLWPMFTQYSGLSKAFPTVSAFRGRHLFLARHANVLQDVEWVSGCCLLIARAALDELGLLTERWFMYGEDIEYCQRVLDAGYRVIVTPRSQATHLVGSSVAKAGDHISTLWARNTYDYYRTQFRPNAASRLAWKTVFSAGLLSRSALFLARARLQPQWRDAYVSRARKFSAFARAVWRE
jgi:GT2 family glycosyltransferase